MISDRVSTWFDLIPVLHRLSIFFYMITAKILFQNQSSQNEFTSVLAPDRSSFWNEILPNVPQVSCQ